MASQPRRPWGEETYQPPVEGEDARPLTPACWEWTQDQMDLHPDWIPTAEQMEHYERFSPPLTDDQFAILEFLEVWERYAAANRLFMVEATRNKFSSLALHIHRVMGLDEDERYQLEKREKKEGTCFHTMEDTWAFQRMARQTLAQVAYLLLKGGVRVAPTKQRGQPAEQVDAPPEETAEQQELWRAVFGE